MLSWLVSWLKICQKQSPDHPGSKIRYQAIGVIDQTLTRCFRAFNWRLCWKRRERDPAPRYCQKWASIARGRFPSSIPPSSGGKLQLLPLLGSTESVSFHKLFYLHQITPVPNFNVEFGLQSVRHFCHLQASTTVWDARLWKRFCEMFSESSTGRWAVLQLLCYPSKQGEL